MLRTPATFPHAGASAFLAPRGEKVRIIRHNADSTAFVELLPGENELRNRDASGNREVMVAYLTETREEATASVTNVADLTDARTRQLVLLFEERAFDRHRAVPVMREGFSAGALAAMSGLGLVKQADMALDNDTRRRVSHYWLTPPGRALAAEAVARREQVPA